MSKEPQVPVEDRERGATPAPERPRPPVANRQAPRTGLGKRLLGPFHLAGAFWLRAALFAARIPEPLQRLGLLVLCAVAWLCLPGIRRAFGRNAELAHGRELGWFARQRAAWRTLRSFAWCFLERNESLLPDRWKTFEHAFEGLEHWSASGAQRGAAVLVTAHVGGWEVGSLRPVTDVGRRLHLVREEEAEPEMQRTFRRALEARAEARYVTHFAARNPELGLELLAALQDGDLVALQGDRVRAEGRSIPVELLGVPYDLPEGPFLLARATEACLLPVFTLRTGRRRYRTLLCAPIRVERTSERARDLADAAIAFAHHLEALLRSEPEQWFLMRDVREIVNPSRR